MSVTSQTSLFQYAIASLGQAFSPAVSIQNTSDLVATYTAPTTFADTLLVLGVDYTVTGTFTNGVCTAPTVTLEAVGLHYATGGTLTIQRLPPDTQPTTLIDGTQNRAATYNNAFDWLCYSIQALNDIVARCLRVPATSAAQTALSLAARAGQLLGFDSSGNAVLYAVPPNVGIQPFPVALGPMFPIYLPAVQATTGGTSTCLDGLNIVGVPQNIVVLLSIADNSEWWKLRAAVGGDAGTSDGTSIVVPVTNPINMRWIRVA